MTKFKKRLLSLSASALMICTMLPVSASATEGNAPKIAQLSIAGQSATTDNNGNLYVSVPGNTQLSGAAFSLTANEAITFQETSDSQLGDLYVSSASDSAAALNFNLVASDNTNFNDATYSINLTKQSDTTWSGTFANGYTVNAFGFKDVLDTASAAGHPVSLRAGSVKNAAGTGNAAYKIYANADAVNTQLVFCDPTATLYTVTYDYGAGSYVWKLPAGAALPNINLPESVEITGWYSDSNYETSAITTGTVTEDVTFYGKPSGSGTTTGSFMDALNDENATILPISDKTDFENFIAYASEVKSNQLVQVQKDIDCDNASYSAIQSFKGNFDGGNKTISNASFAAVDGNSGMFATIGAGQVIANVKLDNITAKNASTYAGVLVGNATGGEGHRALIQNVQVTNSSASGRSAAGVAGFAIFADIKYCSSKNTTITGVANGGGIAGISYGNIICCYSTTSPTALLSSGRGGITGKLLESGNMTGCWCTYKQCYGKLTDATQSSNAPGVDSSFSAATLRNKIGNAGVWNFATGTGTTFKETAITYNNFATT